MSAISFAEPTAYAEWEDAEGVIVLSAARSTLEVTERIALHESTAGNVTARTWAVGVRACTVQWQGYFTRSQLPFAQRALSRLGVGKAGALVWGIFGKAAGLPKRGYPMLVAEQRASAPHGGGLLVSLTLQSNGEPLFDEDALWV